MAKISARGCTEVARVTASNPTTGTRAIFVLRSDGKVLRRNTGDAATGYTVLGKLTCERSEAKARLAKVATRYGYTKVDA